MGELRTDFMVAANCLIAQTSILSMRASSFSGPKLCDWPEQSTKTPGTRTKNIQIFYNLRPGRLNI